MPLAACHFPLKVRQPHVFEGTLVSLVQTLPPVHVLIAPTTFADIVRTAILTYLICCGSIESNLDSDIRICTMPLSESSL